MDWRLRIDRNFIYFEFGVVGQSVSGLEYLGGENGDVSFRVVPGVCR